MRSLLLVPWSLSRVVVGLLWVGILDFEFGALNGLLHNLGLIDRYIPFFKDGFTALNVLVSVYMWNQAPFATLLFLAGMQSVSMDLYSAAEVDGAGLLAALPIRDPSRHPAHPVPGAGAGTVNGFLMLDLIYVLTMGGPAHETTTISWLGFQTTFAFFKFGPGTAILYTLTALCLLLTFIYQRLILGRLRARGLSRWPCPRRRATGATGAAAIGAAGGEPARAVRAGPRGDPLADRPLRVAVRHQHLVSAKSDGAAALLHSARDHARQLPDDPRPRPLPRRGPGRQDPARDAEQPGGGLAW